MQSDLIIAQQAIQLLHQKEQETMRLLELALNQNRILLAVNQQQQTLLAQQLHTINELEVKLHACQLVQRAAFSQVHFN